MSDNKASIAVLIDAENVDPAFAPQIFSYARSMGEVTVREIYGAGIALNEWAVPILENTIHMNMTLRPNRFKNSSDIALVIGAMELLRARDKNAGGENGVDAVVIASSDSDFSPLAVHLRAAGVDVIGMGEPGRINSMWPKACTEFVALQSAALPARPAMAAEAPQPQEAAPAPAETPAPPQQQKRPAPSAPAQEKAEPAKKQEAPKKQTYKIAPSHPARVEIIRAFIQSQLEAHEGRIQTYELFRLLNGLPDYKYDQQRSKRKPLDYLTRQFGDVLRTEEGEDGFVWVVAAPSAKEQPAQEAPAESEQPESAPAAEAPKADSAPSAEEAAPAPEAVPAPEARESDPSEEKPEAAPAEEEPPAPAPSPLARYLASQDTAEEQAVRAAQIVEEARNLFSAYNELRKAFGAAEGRRLLGLVKAYRAQ